MASQRFFLTGGNGFIAQHILLQLLEEGHSVRTTVRSQAKVDLLKKTFSKYVDTPQLEFAIVPDITIPGAFDLVLESTYPFDVVIHPASPFFLRPLKSSDFLDPAIKGTLEILHGITRVAPSVKRVVITSSFTAVFNMLNPIRNPPKVCTADDWNEITLEEALATDNPMITYPASKKYAEKAAWDFVKENKVNFELATILAPGVFGPVVDPSQFESPDALNESNRLVYHVLLRPDLKPTDPITPTVLYLYIDVRDCAQCHILAATVPDAGGRRWFPVAGELGNQLTANYLREALPEKRDIIPIGEPDKAHVKPEGWYTASAPEVEKVLGLKFRSAEETVKDLAPQYIELEKRATATS